jgi:hypothetical protein
LGQGQGQPRGKLSQTQADEKGIRNLLLKKQKTSLDNESYLIVAEFDVIPFVIVERSHSPVRPYHRPVN